MVRKLYLLNCKKCNKEYELELTEHQYKIGKYRKHCCRSCANSHIQTKKQNEARQKKLKGKIHLNKRKRIFTIND